jgi:hypothetical protein
MWISIQTDRTKFSQRMRDNIEAFVRRTFQREQRQIASVVISVGSVKLGGGELGFKCRLKLWSSYLGLVTVRDVGDTVRIAVRQASLRARLAARRRLHRRRSRSRRFSRSRIGRWLPEPNVERTGRKELS